MKQLLLLLVLSAACSEKPNSESSLVKEEHDNILENLTYSIDTVVVDSGNELLNLKDYVFTYSKDFKLTAEGKFKSYSPNQNMGFFKDGKLYCYTPVDENPGYVVYTFNF